jgi:hypothetical protein
MGERTAQNEKAITAVLLRLKNVHAELIVPSLEE